MENKGLLIKDEQGQLYFLRPEILAMCKVEEEDLKAKGMKELSKSVQDLQGVAQGSQLVGGFSKQVNILAEVNVKPGVELMATNPYRTMMCPW